MFFSHFSAIRYKHSFHVLLNFVFISVHIILNHNERDAIGLLQIYPSLSTKQDSVFWHFLANEIKLQRTLPHWIRNHLITSIVVHSSMAPKQNKRPGLSLTDLHCL
jgi:hypothetical protein